MTDEEKKIFTSLVIGGVVVLSAVAIGRMIYIRGFNRGGLTMVNELLTSGHVVWVDGTDVKRCTAPVAKEAAKVLRDFAAKNTELYSTIPIWLKNAK